MAIHSSILDELNKIQKNSITHEFYLTDIVKIVSEQNKEIGFVEINEDEILGINNQIDLSNAEKISQNLLRKKSYVKRCKIN